MTTATATQFLPVITSSASAQADSLVVSVHDVAPVNRPIVEPMLEKLAKAGVRICSLLVVPYYHREKLIAEDPSFLSWLRGLEADGHEIVIHGFFHDRPRRADESITEKIVTRIYTRDEGEFFDLSYDEALRRITQAQEVFREAGLQPRGFIAPAWLLNAEGEKATRDAGLEYTTRLRTVRDLRTGETFGARSLVYSVHNNWRRVASLAWNRLMLETAREKTLLRLSLHPPDLQFPAIWEQVERFIKEAMTTRTPTTYRDWLADQRQRAALN
jgi:hypothetical protein